jgi:protein-disulfide isomerase
MLFRAQFVPFTLAYACLAAVPLRSTAAAEISPPQRQAIEGIIHDYLMQNPDVLIEALRAAEDKLTRDNDVKAKQALTDRRREIFDDPATPVGGDPRGDVAIVEFFDYRCPYCKQVLPALQSLLAQDHRLRFV